METSLTFPFIQLFRSNSQENAAYFSFKIYPKLVRLIFKHCGSKESYSPISVSSLAVLMWLLHHSGFAISSVFNIRRIISPLE